MVLGVSSLPPERGMKIVMLLAAALTMCGSKRKLKDDTWPKGPRSLRSEAASATLTMIRGVLLH